MTTFQRYTQQEKTIIFLFFFKISFCPDLRHQHFLLSETYAKWPLCTEEVDEEGGHICPGPHAYSRPPGDALVLSNDRLQEKG